MRCAELITQPSFDEIKWLFFDRLMIQPHLTAVAVRELLKN
jgi:hypothetical protein